MRLVFEIPLVAEGLTTRVAHPEPRPDNLDRYLVRLLADDRLGAAAWFRTDHGWPGLMVTSATRVAARFEMLHLVAGVVIVAETREALTAAGAAIERHLRSARPDFTDEAACFRGPLCLT